MLSAVELTKKYGSHLALDHVSFELEPGSVYGLLGKNGAGKTTTMNILTGYIGATSGDVIINGKNLLEEPEAVKRQIGYLPEKPPLYADMTVQEYLTFMARLKHVDAKEQNRQIAEVMSLTKIEPVKSRLIGNLSKGYQQRVGLAYAVLGFPEIIILDEPTVGIDPEQMEEVRSLIRALSEKHTVVFSSHILSEVQTLCDHAIILKNGRLAAKGTIAELEAQAGGKGRVSLRAMGEEERVKTVLSSCGAVSSFEITGTETDCVSVRAFMTEEKEAPAEVFRAFSAENIPLLEIRPEELTIEDLFMRFAADEKEGSRQ